LSDDDRPKADTPAFVPCKTVLESSAFASVDDDSFDVASIKETSSSANQIF
jgi:hypothetical protein